MASALWKFVGAMQGLSCGMQLFTKESAAKTARSFQSCGLDGADAAKYLSGSLVFSFASSVLLFASSLFLFSILDSLAILFLSFAALFASLYFIPSALAKRQSALAESELPFLLREIAVYLDIGLPFEGALERIASKKYALSREFARAHKEIKSGSTVQSALASMSSRCGSLAAKRSMLLLSSIYETGSGTESLKRTSEELSSAQLSAMRTQSSRISLLAIIFIACSALIPAFFTVFAAVSPLLSESAIPIWQVYAAFLAVFPLLNLASLALMFFLLPPIASHQKSNSLPGDFLKSRGAAFGTQGFIAASSALSLALSALFLLSGQLLIALFCICIAPAAYALLSYAASREIDEAESRLPDALYSAASTHRLLSAEKMLSFLAKGGFGRLSDSFDIALRRLRAGDSFASCMSAAAAHCPSPLSERAFSLLVVSYETGANMYFALREAAADVVSFFNLVRERSAQLAVQRYTIIAATAVLVPFILGTVVSLAPALSSAAELSGSGGVQLIGTLFIACPAYLFANCIISSLMLSLSETNFRRAALYFAFTAPVSQAVFSIAASSAFSFAGG